MDPLEFRKEKKTYELEGGRSDMVKDPSNMYSTKNLLLTHPHLKLILHPILLLLSLGHLKSNPFFQLRVR